MKAGPWFPFLLLYPGDRLSDYRVNRPRPVKGAGMKMSAVDADESAPPAQEKAPHDEASGSK